MERTSLGIVQPRKGLLTFALIACFGFVLPARAAKLASFAGGALFTEKTGIQAYFSQMAASKNPLLKVYGFMATEHFFVLLRQTQSGGGSLEYQVYADGGIIRKGTGSFTIAGAGLRAFGGQGFRLKLTLKRDQIQIRYHGVKGTYRAFGALRHF